MSTSVTYQDGPGSPEELQIDVPWGHLSALAWGPVAGRPVLCLHGWVDNANTFQRLVPLLPADRRYIALEFSGHGHSSHLPKGSRYDFKQYLTQVCRTLKALNYSRISIIGHSMGGVVGGMYSCMFPEMVDKLILLENYGFIPLPLDKLLPYLCKGITDHLKLERIQKHKVYSQEGALSRLLEANKDLTKESGRILLQRGTKKVHEGVIFSRDIQVSVFCDTRMPRDQYLEYMKSIQASILTLLASDGTNKQREKPDDEGALYRNLVNEFKSHFKERYQLEVVEGNHYVHLNEPEKVAGLISTFLQMEASSSATVQSRL